VEDRSVFYEGLWDSAFFAAPGRWTLWRCAGCRSAYLDPRPDRATIGLAYSRYYTHENDGASQDTRKSIKAALGNGYRNARFGTKFEPALALGRYMGIVHPSFRRALNWRYRYLPKRHGTFQGKVLDIGTGNGGWLMIAAEAGWSVVGADPDPVARSKGAELGLEIRHGGAEAWADQPGTFEFVSMNHVIEHVHDPVQTLRTVFELLRPGGRLFIQTPNLDALGHSIYGSNWRGLEPPRHLVLFNRHSLAHTLRSQGFVNIRFRRIASVFRSFNIMSDRMAAGLDPYDGSQDNKLPIPSMKDRVRGALTFKKSEFLTVTCERPSEI
jgi:2-polyprenyl-3-methyl-5-hydroxy-6-metoxy-1,4-benzoquinol methylase